MGRDQVRVLVVEDSDFMRAAAIAYLRADPEITVVAEAEGPNEAMQALRADDRIDVVVMDLRLRGATLAGLGLAASILKERPAVRIVVYSALAPDLHAETLPRNTRGYVLKTDRPRALVEAVKTVARGGSYTSNEARASDSDGAD